jgi:hypothetical protein
MNGRWIPHYVRFRQRLGLDAVRYNYGATSHDPLAQAAGIFTFHVSPDRKLWQTFGQKETQGEVFASGVRSDGLAEEICAQGIQSSKPIDIVFAPILAQGSRGWIGREPLPAGAYTLTLFLVEPEAERAGERVMRIEIPRMERTSRYTFAPVKARYMRLLCRGNQENKWTSMYEIEAPGILKDVPLTASAEFADHPARAAADNNMATRWAAEGEQWIRFAVNPEVDMDHMDIAWYGQGRDYQFEMQISDDGTTWRPVEYAPVAPARDVHEIDIFKEAGGKNKPLVLEYRVNLEAPGNPSVRLVPVKGRALVCGVLLKKMD